MGVLEYRALWQVGIGGPGSSVFHGRIPTATTAGDSAQALADRVRAFMEAVKTVVPGGVTWSFPSEVLEIDTATGVLEDVHNVTPPANVLATGNGVHAAPAGVRIEWRTLAIVNGRRLRGRTFIVPLSTAQYETNGTLVPTCITTLTNAGNAYKDSSVFNASQASIWSRTHGTQADITSFNVPDEVAVLRSRRD